MISSARVCNRNPYPDYNCKIPSEFLDGEQFKPELIAKSEEWIAKFHEKLLSVIPHYNSTSTDYNLYNGYLGTAYLHMAYFQRTGDKKTLKVAGELVELALKNLRGKRVSFLNGDAGPLAMGAVIKFWTGEEKLCDKLIEKLINLPDSMSDFPDEILYGRAGYLYAFLFVKKHIGNVIPLAEIRKHIEKILRSGYKMAKEKKYRYPLKFEWHDKNYYGAAHGVAGILYILLKHREFLTDYELNDLIKPTLDGLLKERYKSGNFPSSENSDRDRLVQWCHGAPGFVHLLVLASEVYEDKNYLDAADDCGQVVWERGLLSKGYSLCHGVSGNAYTFAHLYQKTKDIKHLHRLACFIHWCHSYPKQEGRKPDSPFSLYEGISGVAYFLHDVLDPMNSSFPAYAI